MAWKLPRFVGMLGVGALALSLSACRSSSPRDGGADGPADSGAPVDLTPLAPPDLSHPCKRDPDCAGGLHCDVAGGRCVACLADGDCPLSSRCTTHECVPGCTRSHGCGDAGACEPDAGVCVECKVDSDCHDGDRPRCDRAAHACVPCLPQNDNCPGGRYCADDGGGWRCVDGCRVNGDCALPDGGQGGLRCEVQSHRCVACLADDDCPPGSLCALFACVPGCNQLHACVAPNACCAGACTDLLADGANCGACGHACNLGGTCCGGACADLASDPDHCGDCRTGCKFANARAACANRSCTLAGCLDGWADCNAMPMDGCEVGIGSDVRNCGRCGMQCAFPHATPGCVGGACLIAACTPGFRDCNQVVNDGCETNTQVDNLNCGACGLVCSQLPRATAICMNGACAVQSCSAGFGNCDRVDANGCETDTTTDPLNCGACGSACPGPAHVVTTCASSVCGLGGCQQGYGDCDADPQNGCEASFAVDSKNCSGCGKACQNGAICVNGACSSVYGAGRDGPLSIKADSSLAGFRETHLAAAAAAGKSDLTLVDATGFVAGDKILVVNVRSAIANDGRWETADVSVVANNTLTLGAPLAGSYPEPGNTIVRTLPQYTDVAVSKGARLTTAAWNPNTLAGGILAFTATGTVTVDGIIAADGLGYRGGIGNNNDPNSNQFKTQGESYPGAGATGLVNNAPNAGGGAGGVKRGGCEGSGGGGGGYSAAGGKGGDNLVNCVGSLPGAVGGNAYGDARLVAIYLGSAGGSGGYTTDPAKGAGGPGGGMILIFAPAVVVTGTIEANGGDGIIEFGDYGGGGGGSGGSVYIRTQQNVAGDNHVVAAGGAGGGANGRNEVGGAGAPGRVFLDVR